MSERLSQGDCRASSKSGKQLAKKLNRRAQELGLDPSNARDRSRFQDRIRRAFDKAEEVRRGTFRGQGPGGRQDVVVTTPGGDFVTFLSGGANNQRPLNGTVIP